LKPSTVFGASILVVEVTERPVAALGQIDNRGTPARGPFEYLGSATINNLLGQHEAVTFTYAGVVPLNELNYAAFNYKQVLTSEGLAFFADASDAWGTPGTVQLETLQYRTLGPYGDAGLSYPAIRSREANLTLSSFFFASNNVSDVLGAPFNDDRLRGFRARADGDFADPFQGISQVYGIVSHCQVLRCQHRERHLPSGAVSLIRSSLQRRAITLQKTLDPLKRRSISLGRGSNAYISSACTKKTPRTLSGGVCPTSFVDGLSARVEREPQAERFCRVALSVRPSFLAILRAEVSLRAIVLSPRTCSDVQARLFDPFFIRKPCMKAGAYSCECVKRKDLCRD
jgi:hypothetical protein